MVDKNVVMYLNYLCRTYDGVNRLLTSTKQRLQAINKEAAAEHQDEIIALEPIKNRIERKIRKELSAFPIWSAWMQQINGIGGFIAANLIMLYYYRLVPVCKTCANRLEKKDGGFICMACGKKAKGDGLCDYRIEEKDFAQISSWWKYMGRHVIDGKMPKPKKGAQVDWSPLGRLIGYHIGEQINRQPAEHPYKAFYLECKGEYEQSRPELTPLHRHRMAMNRAVKLFLSHFWTVARTIDGKPVTQPYAGTILGHTHILEPFCWNEN